METGKSTEYFPHDCNAKDDPKIMMLMSQLGLEAYGIYWILVEYLRQQPLYKAPLILLDPLSRRYGSSKEKFETVVMKYGLFESDTEYFFSPSLTRRMAPLDAKRVQQREKALMRWQCDSNATAMPRHNHGNALAMQSKEEKSRVKKSKEEKSKDIVASFSLSPELIQKWEEWKAFRRQMKKPYKTLHGEEKAFSDLISISNGDSGTAIALIQQSIDREWLGFFPLKNKAKQSLHNEDPVQRMIREATEIMNNSEIQKP